MLHLKADFLRSLGISSHDSQLDLYPGAGYRITYLGGVKKGQKCSLGLVWQAVYHGTWLHPLIVGDVFKISQRHPVD